MQNTKRDVITLMLAVAVMLGLAAPVTLASATDTKQPCAQELGIHPPTATDATAETPVIMVHGLWGDKTSLSAMSTSLKTVQGIISPYLFDYESANDVWVTVGDTAHRLAKTIVCYSKLYGGKKVMVVAHSMGGLLTRAALDWAAYGTFAKNVTGHIVTIGTPHTGADIASLSYYSDMSLCNATFAWWGSDAQGNCRQIEGDRAVAAMHPGSDELAKLPKFPSGISIKAIAGEVSQQICAPWGCSQARSTGGDLVVSVKSATDKDEYTTSGAGDGKKVFACADPVVILNVSHPWCEHNSLVGAPQVQAEVKHSIEDYLASLPQPIPTPDFTHFAPGKTIDLFGRLSIPAPKTWDVSFGHPDEFMNYSDLTTCDEMTRGCPHIHFINLASGKAGTPGKSMLDMWKESPCSYGTPGKAEGPASAVYGGKSASVYRQVCSGGSHAVKYLWLIPAEQLYVDADDGAHTGIVEAALERVRWTG